MAFGEVEFKKKVGMLKGTHKSGWHFGEVEPKRKVKMLRRRHKRDEFKNMHFWRRKLLLSFFIRAIKWLVRVAAGQFSRRPTTLFFQ